MADQDKKIIIDEDWKSRVQREKDEARKTAGKQEQRRGPKADAADELPEASFSALVSSLVTQAMFSLGLIAPADAERVVVDVAQAKFLIDTLMVLRDKTKGNLTAEEESRLTQAVAELQRGYVARAQQAQEAALQGAGIDPQNLKTE
ncbi:MAG TPA: DUF1844 domain-containing protein [Candidatus Hydrogenedentes bacterium]|nr:DUF1844 domain-containing protein [Candidatus Hydrogenedentota bacterium]HIJ74559.1 DUF1844 domain-containing protein [Candidatus Hydrogenedentota bacterium]